MNKKLFISVVPLLATVALAMVPTSALAVEPTWYSEGAQIPEGQLTPTVEWGDLSLRGAAEVTCRTDMGGFVENTKEGGVFLYGRDWHYDVSFFFCQSTTFACPVGFYTAVEPRFLPWHTPKLTIIGGKIRDEVTGVHVKVGCRRLEPGNAAGENEVIGTNFVIGPGQKIAPLAPAGVKKGTGALHPGFFEFDAGSGELEAEGSGGTTKGVIEGELKILGYENQEHIYVQ